MLSRFSREHEVTPSLLRRVEEIARPLAGSESLDPLLERIGDARYVLLGEATHGTSEFYRWRTRLTQRLVSEKGFRIIGVEGDWPDCYAVNRYVRGYPDAARSALEALATFTRWPTWMWANWEVVVLAEWLRQHNENLPPEAQAGFYGLDVYSLWDSMRAVVEYLEGIDPEAARRAEELYRCFDPYQGDEHAYGHVASLAPPGCEDEVVAMLRELRQRPVVRDGDHEAKFDAEQNAVVAVNAERYYRTMMRGGPASWNVRDQHMVDTLERLVAFHGPGAKVVVWEHNTHIGDARYTDMAGEGMVNVGQLVRERRANEGVVAIGFATYQGTVVAGHRWGHPLQRMAVPPAMPGSWEHLLHSLGPDPKLLLFDRTTQDDELRAWRGHRAIGVVYHPEHEHGNYVPTVLPRRYDALLYLDQTEALHPLDVTADAHQPPELYPWGE